MIYINWLHYDFIFRWGRLQVFDGGNSTLLNVKNSNSEPNVFILSSGARVSYISTVSYVSSSKLGVKMRYLTINGRNIIHSIIRLFVRSCFHSSVRPSVRSFVRSYVRR